ncbi:MarR family winged helix-turn-helix transcriptional regulator [Streptomyces sp. MMBL 11-3]|uniref:MarR family winged helix-turn-helix transcriptional regulator n=1 Tax=Streptomyces sp. MMBL 11-3 TaxID=3382639 RepID=UPI0039B658B9
MPSSDIAARTLDQVVQLAASITGVMRDGLEELDLTEPLANLLWILDPEAPPLPLRKLALRLHCDPSNVSQLSVQLEDKGLGQRRPHPEDGRVRTLVLTERGVEVRTQLLDLVAARSPLAVLGDAEQERLQAMLTKALAAPRHLPRLPSAD